MELNKEELTFLSILSDGKKKTFSDIILGFGRMLRHPPNKIAKPLLKLGLVEKSGLYNVTYRITEKGLAVLKNQKK
jgi:predicted transcriptional regulator